MRIFNKKFIFVLLVATLISIYTNVSFSDAFLGTFYSVSGIMFSIGLGLAVNFDISSLQNEEYIKKIRENINIVKNHFFLYFASSTVCYILSNTIIEDLKFIIRENEFNINFDVFYLIVVLFSIIYFTINFLEIQNLKNDIIDRIREEKK